MSDGIINTDFHFNRWIEEEKFFNVAKDVLSKEKPSDDVFSVKIKFKNN